MMEKKRLAMIERSKLRAQNLKKRPIKPPSKSDEFRSKLKMLEGALSNSNKSDFDLKNAQDLYDSLRSHFNNFLNSFPKSDLYLFRNKLHKVECELDRLFEVEFESHDTSSNQNSNIVLKCAKNISSSNEENVLTSKISEELLNDQTNTLKVVNEKKSSKTLNDCKNKHVILESLFDCEIFFDGVVASLMIENCVDCKITACRSQSSAYVLNSTGCHMEIICGQMRLKSCKNLAISAFVEIKTVLEDSKDIKFSNLSQNLVQEFQLEEKNNCWKNVSDFDNPLNIEPFNFEFLC